MVAQHAFLVGASHPPVRYCKEKSPYLRTGSFHKYGGEGGIDSLRSPCGRHGLRPFRPPGCASGRTPSGLLIPRSGAAKKKARTCVRALFSNMAVRGGFEPPIRCRIHTFQACSFSHSDTSPYCLPVVTGTGANVGKSACAVNQLFALLRVFNQTSSNLILKTAN